MARPAFFVSYTRQDAGAPGREAVHPQSDRGEAMKKIKLKFRGGSSVFTPRKAMDTEGILYGIEYMDRADCLKVGQAVQERLAEIRRADPNAYIVKRTLKDGTIRYMTDTVTGGWRQTRATNLDYWDLRVFTTLKMAQDFVDTLQVEKDLKRRGERYEVVAIEKEEFRNLACWPRVKDRADFQPSKAEA
jgi:hypothetical protein